MQTELHEAIYNLMIKNRATVNTSLSNDGESYKYEISFGRTLLIGTMFNTEQDAKNAAIIRIVDLIK
jgi:hypothetical protein